MFEQAELQGTQMCPNDPPNAKGTAQIAPEIANFRKPGLWVILAILPQMIKCPGTFQNVLGTYVNVLTTSHCDAPPRGVLTVSDGSLGASGRTAE